jgi:hypothetical protein
MMLLNHQWNVMETINQKELVILTIRHPNQLHWLNNEEVEYKGQLYDISEQRYNHGILEITAFVDDDEEEIREINLDESEKEQTPNKVIKKIQETDLYIEQYQLISILPTTTIISPTLPLALTKPFLAILSPPPSV